MVTSCSAGWDATMPVRSKRRRLPKSRPYVPSRQGLRAAGGVVSLALRGATAAWRRVPAASGALLNPDHDGVGPARSPRRTAERDGAHLHPRLPDVPPIAEPREAVAVRRESLDLSPGAV